MHPPFRRCCCPCPIRDCFVRDGSAPPALAAVVADNRRFGRAVDDDNDGLPSQSISNIDRVMTSSLCLLTLLVSVIFIAVRILPKRPSQSRRRTTSKKLRSYPPASASVSSLSSLATAAVIALPILPPNEQRAVVNCRHRRHCGCQTPPPPRRGAIVTTIKQRRILSARRRRESSRRRRGSVPLHPSHSSSSVAVAVATVAVAVAALVPLRVLVNAAAVGSVAPDGGSGGAAGASATTASSSTTTPPIGAQTWRQWQRVRMAALMVAAARIGITTTTMPMAITITVVVPVLVGQRRQSR